MTVPEVKENEQDRIRAIDLRIPESWKSALKIAKSLVYWIEHIDKNPDNWNDPIGSMGGHIDHHLNTLNVWWSYEKVKACCNDLESAIDEL